MKEENFGSGCKSIEQKWSQKPSEVTRSQRSSTSAEYNRSALTDHALQENHVINWVNAWMIDRELDRPTR